MTTASPSQFIFRHKKSPGHIAEAFFYLSYFPPCFLFAAGFSVWLSIPYVFAAFLRLASIEYYMTDKV